MSGRAGSLAILNGEVRGRVRDIVVRDGVIVRADPATADHAFDATGGAVLPGLRDAHLHLHAMAARAGSLEVAPDRTRFLADLEAAAAQGGWVRAVGYDPHSVGPLDRSTLDRAAGATPVRVQHRSGLAWIFNTAGLRRLRSGDAEVRVETDATGEPTGRVIGQDGAIGKALGGVLPDPGEVLGGLLAMGVTSVVDATPANGMAEIDSLTKAATAHGPHEIHAMGPPELVVPHPLVRSAVKVVIAEDPLPRLDGLVDTIIEAHGAGLNVAVHCTSHEALVLAVAAWERAGVVAGDRVEHGSVIRTEMIPRLRSLRVAVVVQPSFIRQYGDGYAASFPRGQWADLHRCGSLIRAGITVLGSSDAPFGDSDPWAAMRTATTRMTAGGVELGEREKLTPEQAVALYTPESQAFNTPGAPANLVILDRPWAEARLQLSSALVATTVNHGRLLLSDQTPAVV